MKTKIEWWVADHNRANNKLRGPYTHCETADAVRKEMECGDEYDKCNLWVIQLPQQAPVKPTQRKIRIPGDVRW